MADLSDLGVVAASERGGSFTLRHPATNEETDIVWTMLGFDADVVVQAAREFDRIEADTPAKERKPDQTYRRNIALVIAATTGWENVEVKGKKVEFSPEKAREFLSDANYVWIVNQAERFGSIRRNFFPAPKTA